MKKNLLMLLCLFMASAVAIAQDETSKKLELVSDNVEIPVGKQYRMYIKEYSQAIYDYLQQNPRIAVEFESDDNSIVESGGAWFRGVDEGTTTVKMVVYGAVNSLGYPDYNAKLDEASFTVTVKERVAVSIPTLNTSWGLSREEIKNKIIQDYGYENYTSTYFDMNPTATDEEKALFEILYTGIFEFPVVYTIFNDEDQMWAYQFLISNYERAWTTPNLEDAPIIKILENNGYTLFGTDEGGRPALYNPETTTLVSFTNFILQGQFFMYCTLEYEPENPLDPEAIDAAKENIPTVEINTVGTTVEISADGFDGQTVEMYNANGQLIGKATISGGKASINGNQHMPVIVKVGKSMPVKVIL